MKSEMREWFISQYGKFPSDDEYFALEQLVKKMRRVLLIEERKLEYMREQLMRRDAAYEGFTAGDRMVEQKKKSS